MLEAADQDAVVWDLLRNEAGGFTHFSSYSFFQTLRHHIAEGMFSDPAYGGNRDKAGWKLVSYPGAQRAYLPAEIRSTDPPRPPQSMHELPHFHTGEHEDEPNVVLPSRGTEPEEGDP
jgi:gluconate 2-dehydrogenase gamma chain